MTNAHGLSRVLTASGLDAVLAVVEDGSFSGAAAALDITQSGVSRSIQQIETTLGVELFLRGRWGARPTAALERVLPRMRQVQRELQQITHDLACERDVLRGSIRIAGFRSAISVLLPAAISKFMDRHKRVQISLSTVREHGPGVIQSLDRGEADLALTTVRPPSRLRSLYLGSDRYVVVRPARRSSAPLDKLIVWRERCSEIVPQILREHNWAIAHSMEVDTDTAVLAMVAHGTGFTIMPELATEPLPPNVEKEALTTQFRRHVWLCGTAPAFDSRVGQVLSRYIRSASRTWLERVSSP